MANSKKNQLIEKKREKEAKKIYTGFICFIYGMCSVSPIHEIYSPQDAATRSHSLSLEEELLSGLEFNIFKGNIVNIATLKGLNKQIFHIWF